MYKFIIVAYSLFFYIYRMITVSIIGSGNVALHLISAFKKAEGVSLLQVVARNPEAVAPLLEPSQIIIDCEDMVKVDLVLLAVSDSAITAVSSQIPFENQLVAHTSGSVPMHDLDSKNHRGVFYPLQTFTKGKEVDFTNIPLCLEAEHTADYSVLEAVAKSITKITYPISSEQRKALHVAAVFVCNFVNYMYQLGSDLCDEHHLDFALLRPLIQETAAKVMTISPKEAQTGPARRQDSTTINAHLNYLNEPHQKELYTLLTKSIIDNGKKL
jgi:predicted short-subunit dehydrogenase-like oxidoreductase (DUF2520 family)